MTNVELPRTIAAVVTANGALAAGKHTPVDATAAALTMTLPAASTANAGSHLSVEKVDSTTNSVTVSGSIRGTTSTIALVLTRETVEFRADAAGSWWPIAGHKTKTSLDALYAQTLSLVGSSLSISGPSGNSVTIPTSGGATVSDATTIAKGIVQLAGDLAGTAAAPTLANTPTARTNLGLGSAATQPASAFLASGAQAVDTAKVNGITVTGTPAAGQALVASSTSAATWAVPAITGQYVGSAATYAGLPTTDAAGQAASNGDWAFLTADVIGTGTATAPQYPRGAYITNGTTYTLAVTLGADFVIGTTAGTVAAGNDSRIVGAAQIGNNLSDLTNAGTARTSLGLGTAATQASTAFDPAGAATTAQAAAIAASQGAWTIRTVTTATTAAAWDYVLADTTAATFAVAAPTPTTGKQWAVKWKAGTVAPTLTGTFNSTPTFSAIDQAMEFISDGTSWYRTVRPALAQLPDYPALTDARYDALGAAAAIRLGGTVNAITSSATAVAGVRNTVDATAGAVTVTLPTPTAVGQHLIIERLDATTVNAITVTGTIRGVGAATATLPAAGVAGEGALWIAESLTSWVPAGSIKPKAWLDALYAPKPTGTPAAGKYVDGGTGSWTTLPAGGGGSTPAEAALIPPIGGAVFGQASNTAINTPTVGSLVMGLLYVPPATYNSAAIRVSSTAASSTVKIVGYAVSSAASNMVGSLLFETVATAVSSTGVMTLTFTAFTVASPGAYIWVGLVNQVAASGYQHVSGASDAHKVSTTVTGNLIQDGYFWPTSATATGVTGAAPAATAFAIDVAYVPRVALIRSA